MLRVSSLLNILKRITHWAVCCCAGVSVAFAQIYDTNGVVVSTFVGSGFSGWIDGVGGRTMFNSPTAIAKDSLGNLFVWDSKNACIRKVTPDGVVSTFAGGGTGAIPGQGTNVLIQATGVVALTTDSKNTIWMAANDSIIQPYILRITSNGVVGKAPSVGLPSFSAFGGICADNDDNIYVSITHQNRLVRYRDGVGWESVVGSGNAGSTDGNGVFTSFYSPAALAVDAIGNVFVWDSENKLIRKVTPNRDVSTYAGTKGSFFPNDGEDGAAAFDEVFDMAVDPYWNLVLACRSSIRRVSSSGVVTTIAGEFPAFGGYADGGGQFARFGIASGICFVRENIYITDSANQRIRLITTDPVATPINDASLEASILAGVRITGTPGRTYRIESSVDSITWRIEDVIVVPTSPFLWVDQKGLGDRKMFRAFLLP